MKRALVIGASGGIGSAMADTLRRNYAVDALSRSADGLDVTDEASVEATLSVLPGPYDLVFVATGALEIDDHRPEKTIRQVDPEAMLAQFKLNTIGPSLILKHALRLMPKSGRSVFAALSARVGSIGDNRLGGWYSYRTSKAALNQMIHTAAVEVARTHPDAICVAMHPGTVATKFTEKYVGRHPAVPPHEAASNIIGVIEGLDSDDTGKFFDRSGKEVVW